MASLATCLQIIMLQKKDKKKEQADMNKDIDNLYAILLECNLVGNFKECWIDSGAIRHVCSNKKLFSSYTSSRLGEAILMKISATEKIKETGKIGLKMTVSGMMTFNNVLHIFEMRKNLFSTSILGKNKFKYVFVSDKVVISKNDMYVGKSYLTRDLFKLNVIAVDMNKSSASYFLEIYNLLHARLGYVNYKTLRKMINFKILPKFESNNLKCQVCGEYKCGKYSYKPIKRNSNLLNLVYTNIVI